MKASMKVVSWPLLTKKVVTDEDANKVEVMKDRELLTTFPFLDECGAKTLARLPGRDPSAQRCHVGS